MKSRFNKHGCYRCRICGKQTRDTAGEGCVELCRLCDVKALEDNGLQDNGYGDHWCEIERCNSESEVYALVDRIKRS